MMDTQVYTVNMIYIVSVAGTTAALLKLIYNPSSQFVVYKRRTIEHSRRTDELRLLCCVHNADNVPPLISLIDSTHPSSSSPICLYLLHLIPLAGRTTAVLAPYKKKRRHRSSFKSQSSSTLSDHIVNAFRRLEIRNLGRLSILPFIATSPYATMHDDVCSLALDRRVVLVILPFHRNNSVDATTTATINVNVLRYAPCSVAILVDHTVSGAVGPACVIGGGAHLSIQRVAVYFLGGADDREALAYAARMAENPDVELTAVRFLPENGLWEDGEEEMLDDEAVGEFRGYNVDGKRVVYREEVVRDGAGTVDVIRGMCDEEYSLLVVGRREGKESALTAGLETWSEYPELGVIGDVLASADFGVKVSTLVVQQQARVGEGMAADTTRQAERLAAARRMKLQQGEGDHSREEMEDVLMEDDKC